MTNRSKARRKPTAVRRELTQAEAQEFLRIVRDDLTLLRKLNFAKPLRSEVRVASSILRRLLHELMFLNAWSLAELPGEPRFKAVDLDGMLNSLDGKYIHYAYAGGASTEGAQYRGYVLLVVPKVEVETEGQQAVIQRVRPSLKPAELRDFTLAEFCESACVVSGHAKVSRLAIVRYVANKLGGVHWDNERGEWSDPVASRHRFLDEAHLIVGRLPAPLYEVLSIAQAIAESNDTESLIQRIEEVAPEEEGAMSVLRFREGRTGKYADMTFNAMATPQDEV